MKKAIVLVTSLALSITLTACKNDSDGDQFIGHWQGVDNMGHTFDYVINREGTTFNISSTMTNAHGKVYNPDFYTARAINNNILTLTGGDMYRYDPETNSIADPMRNLSLKKTGSN